MHERFTARAVGTSLTWGQGLRHEDKFATLAVEELADDGGLDETDILARSGAVVGIHRFPEDDPFDEAVDEEVPRNVEHEVPWSRPTIRRQLETLRDEIDDPAELDLLLLDGGINDVSVRRILLPFVDVYDGTEDEIPVMGPEEDPPDNAELEDEIRTYCYDDMLALLDAARRWFPEAVVVVSGYFQIASEDTEWRPIDEGPILFDGRRVLERIAVHRAQFFAERSLYWLRRAVAEVAADPEWRGPGVIFAHPGFEPRNSIEAPEALLWPIGDDDPLAEERQEGCVAAEGHLSPGCRMASTGHPNVAGARRYADVIVRRYRDAMRASVREMAEELETDDLREEVARYGFDPADGLAALIGHRVVDSVTVEVITGDSDTLPLAELSLAAGRWWPLDNPCYWDLSAGDTDEYSFDPVLDGDGRLRLADVDRLAFRLTDDYPEWMDEAADGTDELADLLDELPDLGDDVADRLASVSDTLEWTLTAVRLRLNGVVVHEWTGERTLEAGEEFTIPDYPGDP